jgi:transcriptional regulator with XRE-family HTH domain
MALPRQTDPASSPAALFGAEVRRLREAQGWSQDALGEKVSYSGQLVGLIENARRTPSRDFAESCDRLFKVDGLLMRMWPLVHMQSVPAWFRGYVELEATASKIETFECQNVPGLLQTEGCARALFSSHWPRPDVDALVSTRFDRQQRILASTGPTVWAILDEAVLRRPIGSPDTWCEQLKHLADVSTSGRIVLQVLPFSVGAHACMDGAMTLLGFAEGPDVIYIESPGSGKLIEQPEEVEKCQYRYNLIRARALSPEASVSLITAVMEQA